MAEDVQPIKALYYPQVQFYSPNWLRTALLYWEGVLRLVPDGFQPVDPPIVSDLADLGLVESVSPAPYIASAKDKFLEKLNELLQGGRERELGFRRRIGLAER